jgi:uracil-DNA glycosylase
LRLKDFPFAHAAQHPAEYMDKPLRIFDSYHCSRYNTNTGRLTEPMFEDVFRSVRAYLGD